MKTRTGYQAKATLLFASLLTGVTIFTVNTAEADGNMPPADNALYVKECGSCHNAFLPGLLPSISWQRVMDGLDKHFGEDASIDEKDTGLLRQYLSENAADRIRAKRSRKIMRSLSRGDAPMRITEIPYLVRKHRELNPEIYKRKEIRTFSNCFSCHPEGSRGNFEEDFIRIPGDNYAVGSLSSGAAKVSIIEAMNIAQKQYPGDITKIEMERGLYEIKIRTQSGSNIKVFVDPTDGKFIENSFAKSSGGQAAKYSGDTDDRGYGRGGSGQGGRYGGGYAGGGDRDDHSGYRGRDRDDHSGYGGGSYGNNSSGYRSDSNRR